ncbi:MAG TPA: IPT/TIG domain-containing protein, partial [Clostridia bacterium]|nr:IPT/TIG domain-containing protein [Clostridia bacterium]
FIYVKTYTDPKIIDFNPKKGTANTFVSIKGENFVPVDTLVKNTSGVGAYKLVGTRVFLGGEDINIYNLDSSGKIALKNFSPEKPLVEIRDREIGLVDYFYSIILVAGDKYYKIYTDTRTGKILITDGDKDIYELIIKGDKIIAKKGSVEKEVDISVYEKLILKSDSDGDLEFNVQTLYETNADNTEIIGNRVKVSNSGELTFMVPRKEKEGYYDVTIVNPDTKKDSRIGNSGFYYFFQPQTKPTIINIEPNKGSTFGDYYINIYGENFKDYGDGGKASIYIGSIKIDTGDTEISPDGKRIRVKVPKYPGDLNVETDIGRKTVPVVVVNPDGATANEEYGFTYVIPISNPKITTLILNKGSAAGNEIVNIEGTDFRFFEPFKDANNNYTYDEDESFDDLNENETWDDLLDRETYGNLKGDYENLIKPILPAVYFGNQFAEVLSFSEGTIEVKTPKGISGQVDVYLVNNDYGVSNKVKYFYEGSNPKITDILPATGRKQGSEKIEIMGEDFKESKVRVVKSVDDSEEQSLQIVQFGNLKDTNISNRDIPMDATQNSGRIRDNRATVKVGNLTIKYDATQDKRKLNFTIEEGTGDKKAIYNFEYTDYDDTEVFLPVSLLKKESGNTSIQDGDEGSGGEDINVDCYDGYEYVKINLEKITGASTTNRLRADRGFSPEATLIRAGQITLNTPSYYTVGSVPVTLINPDGGTATGNFEYKNPDSDPQITNITRDGQQPQLANDGENKILTVNVKGGSIITVEGKDFRDVRL